MILHFGNSIVRLAIGYSVAVIGGITTGAVVSLWPDMKTLVLPFIDGFVSIPTMAWVPLLLVTLGLADTMVVAAIILSVYFVVVYNTVVGIESVPKEIVEAASIDGASKATMLVGVVLPNALAPIIAGLRLGLAYGWRALVGAEMVAAMLNYGIGKLIYQSRFWNQAETLATSLILICLFGLVTDRILMNIEKKTVLSWGNV